MALARFTQTGGYPRDRLRNYGILFPLSVVPELAKAVIELPPTDRRHLPFEICGGRSPNSNS
jgi:hypothetical protein